METIFKNFLKTQQLSVQGTIHHVFSQDQKNIRYKKRDIIMIL